MENELCFADTNLFLRYLANDIPEQADAIESLFRAAANGSLALVTNSLVIAEIVWVLESYYQLSKADIQTKVTAILNTPGLEVMDEDIILQAILWYAEKNVDFIDAYNAAWMIDQGINQVFTLDRKHFSRFEGITALLPGGRD